jgi:hypothetical protein
MNDVYRFLFEELKMGYTVDYLPDEPIMVVRIQGDFTNEMLHNMFADTAAFIDHIEGRVYRVIDCTDMALSLQDFMKMMRLAQETGKPQRGSGADPNVTAALVGSDEWVSLYRDSLRTRQGAYLSILATIDEAIDYLRQEVYRHSSMTDTQETPYVAPQE